MNRTVKLLVFISILAGFTGCSRDTIDDPDSFVPEGYIRAALDLQVEKPDSIQTRATAGEEDGYDESNIWVLLFNATSSSDGTPKTLVQAPVKATKSGNQLYVLLRATTQPVTLYVVSGLSDALNISMGKATDFVEGTTDFIEVNNKLQTDAVNADGVPIGSGKYFHMSSEPVFYSTGTIPITSITQPLTRNVAKIDIDASALATSDFQLEGVTLVNGAQKGFVFKQPTILPNHGGATVRYDEKTTVTDNKITSQIYLYENAAFLSNGTTPNPTKLVVRGKYKGGESGYYRMDILKNNNGTYTPYDIKRNHCYTLKIEKIENGGYRTIDEAIAAEPSNTWYVVDVKDKDSYDVVSNGHYYLGVSNSEFVVYGDPGQIENLHITTVTTDAPAGTHTSISASNDLSVLTASLTTLDGTAKVTKIYAALNETTNGYIDLRVGNLTKRIKVQRKESVKYGNSEKTDFIDPEYVRGEVVSGMEWVRLAAASNANFNVSPPSLTNPTGGIYVRYNSTLNMNSSRSAELYVSKANEHGRAKMLLFATAVTYVNSTLPNNIDKNGEDINSNSEFTATFNNPGNYPFTAGITPDNSATVLMETASNTTAIKDIDLAGVKAVGTENLPRGLKLKYKVNGVWLETGKNFQQRTFLNVRILSVGGSAININSGVVNYGTQLGSALPGCVYTNTLGTMLHLHTGSGKPIENKFELFNLSDGATTGNGPTRYNNIGQILRNNNIDILFCSINNGSANGGVGPNASQVQEILNWLDENPYRGMIFITDYPDNAEITKALFGVPQTSASGSAPYSKLPQSDPYYNNPVYKAIMFGSYSTLPSIHSGNPIDLRETTFTNAPGGGNAYGGVPLTKTNAAGFIPIFYVTIDNTDYVLFAVHPSKNIVMMGDINWFTATSAEGFLNTNGSLGTAPAGNYPKMIMNMWEWYINSVALGRGTGN